MFAGLTNWLVRIITRRGNGDKWGWTAEGNGELNYQVQKQRTFARLGNQFPLTIQRSLFIPLNTALILVSDLCQEYWLASLDNIFIVVPRVSFNDSERTILGCSQFQWKGNYYGKFNYGPWKISSCFTVLDIHWNKSIKRPHPPPDHTKLKCWHAPGPFLNILWGPSRESRLGIMKRVQEFPRSRQVGSGEGGLA